MTREEAVKMIKDDIRLHHNELSGKYRHALNIAIKALEQPEIIRCKDCSRREICRTTSVWAVAPSDDWYCADAETWRGEEHEL